ncbi:PIG-L deacetylase family protein [Salinirarus marinus]|uniref:PIG-L deacetylase family protein n=1 Tax=Salinirarus marinus TaxID=3068310 RepID=UPI003C6C2842
MTVLCIVAHPDDEVLGVGGTLARHAEEGEDVHICILSDGVTSRYDDTNAATEEIEDRRGNARQACDALGATVNFYGFPDNRFDTVPLLDIVQTIEKEIKRCDPDIVYTHHYGDLNVDHELACQATVTATRPLQSSNIEQVLAFETLSASEWSTPASDNAFQPTMFVDVSNHLDRKIAALTKYENELRASPHPRTTETVRDNAAVWGAKSGVDAAEPFELLRSIRRYS